MVAPHDRLGPSSPRPPDHLVLDYSPLPKMRRITSAFAVGALALGGWTLYIGGRKGHLGIVAAGGFLFLLGLGVALLLPRLRRRYELRFDRSGISLLLDGAVDEHVDWAELVEARVSYARKASGTSGTVQVWAHDQDLDPAVENVDPSFWVDYLVRVDLLPRDAGFLDRHPDLRGRLRYTGRGDDDPLPGGEPWHESIGEQAAIIRLPLGNRPDLFDDAERAVRTFAGSSYRPPRNEGVALGFKYS